MGLNRFDVITAKVYILIISSLSKLSKDNKKLQSVFILCESCHWCATFLDKSRLLIDTCKFCNSRNLSSFPILPDESFVFDYTPKSGVELKFKRRKPASSLQTQ